MIYFIATEISIYNKGYTVEMINFQSMYMHIFQYTGNFLIKHLFV